MKNKNIIKIIEIIAIIMIPYIFLKLVVNIEKDKIYDYETTDSYKTYTKQVCDYTGYDSRSIIEKMAQQGYTFTGTTKTFMCKNTLNFQLQEGTNEK